jgi:hypothetical protein
MNEEQINKVKLILTDWNPLGDQASKVEDLNNYENEAIDILFCIDKKSSVDRINKIMTEVISQAFGLYPDLKDTVQYAKGIKSTFNTK